METKPYREFGRVFPVTIMVGKDPPPPLQQPTILCTYHKNN